MVVNLNSRFPNSFTTRHVGALADDVTGRRPSRIGRHIRVGAAARLRQEMDAGVSEKRTTGNRRM